MLKHAKGNLIDMAEQGMFDIIVHGCNCQHTMGSGLAKEIRERYPLVYTVDGAFNPFGNPIENLGNYSIARALGNPQISGHRFCIVNAYTQLHYLPRGIDHFEYDSFKVILRKLKVLYPKARFGFPYIGMGLAGGDPDRIIPIIEAFANEVTKTGGTVTLVEFA